jgi:uncharacterized protein YdiU (UPF0061 family)
MGFAGYVLNTDNKFMNGGLSMIYTFSCPAPCKRMILIDACTDEDAVDKLIKAGAMICRNSGSHGRCGMTHLVMPPLPDKRLRAIVRLHMQAGDIPVLESTSL